MSATVSAEPGLPAPFVPADCDLANMEFMPLLVGKLQRSRLWARCRLEPELGFFLISMLIAAWQSFPASSLEDDDYTLAAAAGCDMTTWQRVKAKLMAGWVRCSDGRLYHPVLSDRANETWDARTTYRESLAKAREAKRAKREARMTEYVVPPAEPAPAPQPVVVPVVVPQPTPQPTPAPTPVPVVAPHPAPAATETDPPLVSETPPHFTSPDQRETADFSVTDLKYKDVSDKEEKRSLRSPRRASRRRERVDPLFDEFYAKYPVDADRRFARIQWDASLARGISPGDILQGLAKHRFADHACWIQKPANWLAAEAWRSPGVTPREKPRNKNGWVQLILDDRAAREAQVAQARPFGGLFRSLEADSVAA